MHSPGFDFEFDDDEFLSHSIMKTCIRTSEIGLAINVHKLQRAARFVVNFMDCQITIIHIVQVIDFIIKSEPKFSWVLLPTNSAVCDVFLFTISLLL